MWACVGGQQRSAEKDAQLPGQHSGPGSRGLGDAWTSTPGPVIAVTAAPGEGTVEGTNEPVHFL